MRGSVGLAIIAVMSGCAAPRALLPAGGVNAYAPGFVIELPADWVRTDEAEGLTATRDGFHLQLIRVTRSPIERPDSPLKGYRSALPEERAEAWAAVFAANFASSEVLEVQPATLSGAPGFRMTTRWRDPDGLQYMAVRVAAVIEGSEWSVFYSAPARHYFQLDLGTFDRTVAGFRISPAASAR